MLLLLTCAQIKMHFGMHLLGFVLLNSLGFQVLAASVGIVCQYFAGVQYRWAAHVLMFSKSPQKNVLKKSIVTKIQWEPLQISQEEEC